MTDLGKAVFLSYATQDAVAAQQLCNALRDAGIEVWFDQSELRGGDAWDSSIRRQIKSCALFIALISANTRARTEGYFRLEWKLAIDRSHLMASERAFLIPVSIDATGDADTTVPDRFREVQWTKLADGVPTKQFVERVSRLLAAGNDTTAAGSRVSVAAGTAPPSPRRPVTGGPTRRYILAAVALALVLGGTWFFQHRATAPAPIVAYSAEDRRMTFAVLPLQATGEDPIGEQIAKTTGDAVFTSLDENHEWVQLARQVSVTNALKQLAAPRDLAKSLKVHFLFRGSVTHGPSGYSVTLFVVDGETEHVLGTKSLAIPINALTPRSRDEIDNATGLLVFHALESEVARARSKPDAALDVRDLTFRAFVDWGQKRMADDGKGAYTDATELLNRALALAPDDPLALRMTTKINLCDCVDAWSPNVAKQQAIGEVALDRYLRTHPDDPGMLHQKAILYQIRGRFQESLLILDSLLNRDPENSSAMEDKALALLRLGRPKEAAAPAASAYAAQDREDRAALLAAIEFELADYAGAERLAQKAITEMSKAQLSNSNAGTVRLTLIAAAAHLHDDTAKNAALSDLAISVPELTSLGAIRKWMSPQSYLSGYEPLFEGLKLAGLHN